MLAVSGEVAVRLSGSAHLAVLTLFVVLCLSISSYQKSRTQTVPAAVQAAGGLASQSARSGPEGGRRPSVAPNPTSQQPGGLKVDVPFFSGVSQLSLTS